MDRINDLKSTVQNLKRTMRVVKNVASIAQKATPILTSPFFWVFFIIVLVAIILLSPTGLPGSGGGGESNNQQREQPASSFPPIAGLTLTLTGPDFINNGELISYSISVSYDPNIASVPIENITVFNSLPNNTEFSSATGIYTYEGSAKITGWPLKEVSNRGSFSIVIKPTLADFFLTNRVYARGAPPLSTAPGGVCSEGFSYCSVDYLKSYFGGDENKARQASIICNKESGSNPGARNTDCGTNDYSIGLFQINLVAHCPDAYGAGTWGPQSCDNLIDVSKRDVCETKYADPIENIKKAVEISSGGTYWIPWPSAKVCGIIN